MLDKLIYILLNICLFCVATACFVASYECPFLMLKFLFFGFGVLMAAFMLVLFLIFKEVCKW